MQKTLRKAYPKKKVMQLQTNQREPSMCPTQTNDNSCGEIHSAFCHLLT